MVSLYNKSVTPHLERVATISRGDDDILEFWMEIDNPVVVDRVVVPLLIGEYATPLNLVIHIPTHAAARKRTFAKIGFVCTNETLPKSTTDELRLGPWNRLFGSGLALRIQSSAKFDSGRDLDCRLGGVGLNFLRVDRSETVPRRLDFVSSDLSECSISQL